MTKTMRVQRFIAQAALASRREAEKMIEAGRVRVNGKVVREMGLTVDPDRDQILVDNQPVSLEEEKVYVLLHKPPLTMTTRSDPRGRQTVYAYLKNLPPHLAYVGRLDWDAEGALLFTNDGDFVHAMTHPKYHVPKTYLVKVNGIPDNKALDRLRRGVRLDDNRRTQPCEVEVVEITHGDNAWLKITLWEGRQNQIKRMMDAIRFRTNRIFRTHIGDIYVGNLPQGEWRFLTDKEVHRLLELVSDGAVELPKVKRQVDIPAPLPEKSRAPRGRSPKSDRGTKDPGRGRGTKPLPRFSVEPGDDETGIPARGKRGRKTADDKPQRGKRSGKPDTRSGKPEARTGKPDTRSGSGDKPQRGKRGGKPDRRNSGEEKKQQGSRSGREDFYAGGADEKPQRSGRGSRNDSRNKPARKTAGEKSQRNEGGRKDSHGRPVKIRDEENPKSRVRKAGKPPAGKKGGGKPAAGGKPKAGAGNRKPRKP